MKLFPRTPLLTSALAISFLAMSVSAQSTTDLPDLATATATTASTAANTGAAATNTGSSNTGTTSAAASSTGVVITGSGTSGQASTAPVITGTTASNDGALTGLPTLSGGYVVVAPSVPPTANAPYMQTSNLPEGTVFIVVGAILGFMAMSVLLWRGLVAWSLHRSVKRAANMQNMTDTKEHFRTPAAPFYKSYSDHESTMSLTNLTPKGAAKGGKKSQRPRTGDGNVPSNLFFSPTATTSGAGLATTGNNRNSSYLPAGYYASGAAAPANGAGHVSIGGHVPSISLSNLGHQSMGYSRARSMGPSPPDSPGYSVDRASRYGGSSSTLNLNAAYGGQERVPSAYLEDLMNDTAPLPPPGHVSHSRSGSGGLRDRN